MNLWAKRAGLLLSAAVLFFLLSCEDDSYLLGFQGKTKFSGRYAELSVGDSKSSVLLLDSVVTDHYSLLSTSTNRLLIGRYTDPALGTVESYAFAQFNPYNPTSFNTKNDQLQLDSIYLELLYDGYSYGPYQGAFDETVTVHRLLDSLSFYVRYHSTSTKNYDPTPLGTLRLTGRKIDIDYATQNPSATDRKQFFLKGRLDQAFGQELLNYANSLDSALMGKYIRENFMKQFYGLAFVPTTSSRMLGFTQNTTASGTSLPASRLTLHYKSITTPADDSLTTSFYFTSFAPIYANSFNRITTLRTGDLAGLSQPYTPFMPASNNRYIQSGSGVISTLDISDFYNFADTVETVLLNSVEISIGVEAPPQGMSLPSVVYAMILQEEGGNKIVLTKMSTDADSIRMLKQRVYTDQTNYAIASDVQASPLSPLALSYDSKTQRYRGYATMFFQNLLAQVGSTDTPIKYVGLYPVNPAIGKSVNRAVLKANDMKIKIYYTKPNLPNLE